MTPDRPAADPSPVDLERAKEAFARLHAERGTPLPHASSPAIIHDPTGLMAASISTTHNSARDFKTAPAVRGFRPEVIEAATKSWAEHPEELSALHAAVNATQPTITPWSKVPAALGAQTTPATHAARRAPADGRHAARRDERRARGRDRE